MTMIEGVIVGWHKKENDTVREGEPLVEIETDKIVECLAASVSGVLLKIMAKVGDVVPVDSPICLIGNTSEAASERSRAVREGDIENKGALLDGNDGIGSRRTVRLPRMNDRMAESLVIRWHKKEGESFHEGESLLDVETETTLRSVAAPFAGAVGKILAFPGEVVSAGSDLCIVDSENSSVEEKMLRNPAGHAAESGRINASPAARRSAAEKGITLIGVRGTGPGAMIVSADVPDVSAKLLEGVEAGDEIFEFTGIRRRIADNLMMSKRNAADVTTVTDVDMERIRELRRNLPLSYTSFIVRAAALALTEYPVMNSSLKDEKIVVRKRININVAVSTERGLITPVIRDADRKNAVTIAEELDELSSRGREGNISAEDFKGGSFTVTNSGVFGALFFTPILNYPQCGVLGVGRISPAPVVRGDAVVASLVMYLSLTYDHRVVDGETAVRFLQRIRFYLENPDRMIVFSKKEKKNDG
jgi:pyruvate/2-oxoglutarate dehydrogenase complex dihydrolipoamide acyltransferase (E2) component